MTIKRKQAAERKMVLAMLTKAGTQRGAAKLLSISQTKIHRLIHAYKITSDEYPSAARGRKISAPNKSVLAEYCRTMTTLKISQTLNVSWGTAAKWIELYDLKSQSALRPRMTEEDKWLICQLQDLKAADVGDKFDISGRWVKELWARHNRANTKPTSSRALTELRRPHAY